MTVRRGVVVAALGAAAMAGAGAIAPAAGQSKDGAYASLSPGHRRIARALHAAQERSAARPGLASLTLEQIATLRASGQGWNQVFSQMKARGLLEDITLGQALSRYNHADRLALPRRNAGAPEVAVYRVPNADHGPGDPVGRPR